jgi:DNA-binding transcriptional LysR family regulator
MVESERPERGSAPIRVELRHLRYFLAVSEELHFGRAALRLHMAQPPLSQAIRKLEDELGVELLHRTSRVVTPTEAGRVFAKEARKILATFDRAVAEARRAGGEQTVLRIGCIPHLPMERLLRFLSILHEREPGFPTQVTHLSALEQVKSLRDGDLDLGVFDYAEDHANLSLEPVFQGEPMATYLPPDHPLAQNSTLCPEELVNDVLVTFPREGNAALYDEMLSLIEGAGYRFSGTREAGGDSPRDLMLAVAEGTGLAFGPFSMGDVSEAGGIVVRRSLDPPVSMPDIVVAWPTSPPRQLRMLLAAVREAAQEIRRLEPKPATGGLVSAGQPPVPTG